MGYDDDKGEGEIGKTMNGMGEEYVREGTGEWEETWKSRSRKNRTLLIIQTSACEEYKNE